MSCLCGHSWVEHPNKGICTHLVDGVICACLKLSPSDMPDFGIDAEAWRAYILAIRSMLYVEIHKQFAARLKERETYADVVRDVIYSSLGPEVGTTGVGVTGPTTTLSYAAQVYAHERSADALLKLEREALAYAKVQRNQPLSAQEQKLRELIAVARALDPLEQAAELSRLHERNTWLGQQIGRMQLNAQRYKLRIAELETMLASKPADEGARK